MKYYYLTIFIIAHILTNPVFSQEAVILVEDKKSKRWDLYAQNNTAIEQQAFLLIQGEGFRRSADRPVIKKIPPHSKVLMITLIPLKGVTPTYTKIFTFEEQLQTISKRKGEDQKEHVNLLPVQPEELTIFIEKDCKKCDYLIKYLNKNRIKHRKLDVKKNDAVFDMMWSHLRDSISGGVVVKLPILMKRKKMYFDIFNMEHFIQNFDWNK